MANFILGEEERKILLTFFEEKRKDLLSQVRSLDQKIEELKHLESAPKSSSSKKKHAAPAGKYKRDDTWNEKIQWAMVKNNGKLLTSLEISNEILLNEPELNKDKVRTSIAATLSTGHTKGKYHRKLNENGDFVYNLM